MRIIFLAFLIIFCFYCTNSIHAQKTKLDEKTMKEINYYFLTYKQSSTHQYRVLHHEVDIVKKKIKIHLNECFADQEFTHKNVKNIYRRVYKALPKSYNKYILTIYTNNIAIEKLIAGYETENTATHWGTTEYDGNPWVKNISQPHKTTHGLNNRHISLWASHGMYYDSHKGTWRWQRPNIFGTTEDLFTPTIVTPYLIPMLEKAGANVFTPRERDLQTQEIIVDNDNLSNGFYQEESNITQWNNTPIRGFAMHNDFYHDGENPFTHGTARMTFTSRGKRNHSFAVYQPNIPEEGKYAVYVSYQTMDGSIDDAEYTVYHKGQSTVFHVNQRMGGGTWVYLGTFDFDKGYNIFNRVVVSSKSKHEGIITTDAVRFGGGMGNIRRGTSVSGMPRALEGARYTAQWYGAPYNIYGIKGGQDDYSDDINVRSLITNWLAGGSTYIPSKEGKKVPIELALAIHSDAGYSINRKDIIGSLAICTTQHNNRKLSTGHSRMLSHDFASILLKSIERDIHKHYGKWNIRGVYDKNYSETRIPEIPSAILETLSHQNFPDMQYGQDPNFKFILARSIYKSILKFINIQHGKAYTVTPLCPINFRIKFINKKKIKLQWDKQDDTNEPTATPTSYNVYIATGSSGFDNGKNTKKNYMEIELEPGIQYNFRVTAVNRGGESFSSETLSAFYSPMSKGVILIINNFNRLASPAIINTTEQQGFNLSSDLGVNYGRSAGWIGKQINFNTKDIGKEGIGGLGYSGKELQGQIMAGNTFDYVKTHTEAIAATNKYSVVSASAKAIENGLINLSDYLGVDLILGLEKSELNKLHRYKTFSSIMQEKIKNYLEKNGRLFVSGSYIGNDMQTLEEQLFLSNYLKFKYIASSNNATIHFNDQTIDIWSTPNTQHYSAASTDILQSVNAGYIPLKYKDNRGAAVAYIGNDYKTFTMGFPFECIKDKQQRNQLMEIILQTIIQ